jgi:hypothetical protein
LNPTEKNKISRRDGHFSLYIVVLGVSLGMESDEEDLLSTAFSVSLSLCVNVTISIQNLVGGWQRRES